MWLRMLAVHNDPNDSHEVTINGYQDRKINQVGSIFFGFELYGKPSSALSAK